MELVSVESRAEDYLLKQLSDAVLGNWKRFFYYGQLYGKVSKLLLYLVVLTVTSNPRTILFSVNQFIF